MARSYLSVEEAAERLIGLVTAPDRCQQLPLLEAPGRVCGRDLAASMDQPPFDRSPLDGYALRHTDLAGASPAHPACLKVVRQIFAGDPPGAPLEPGQAVRIMTGAPIPPGADCVIRQEDTDCGEETVRVFQPLSAHDNICPRGEDLRAGFPLLSRGQVLTSAHVGVLAGQGIQEVPVFPRPRIGLLATGSELTPPGQPLAPGKIHDSNQYYLSARLTELGMLPVWGQRRGDDPAILTDSVAELLDTCGGVITTGGVSVGLRDYMPQVCRRLGARELFHGVAVKPGAPVLAMVSRGKPVICLSGNPFAAAATLELLARPMLWRMAGRRDWALPRASGVLETAFPKASPGRRLVRASIRNGAVSIPAGSHVSGSLSTLMDCNCLVDIPAGSPPLSPGTQVEVVLL